MEYIISDIHGCSKTLKALLSKLNFSSTDTLYFLGDYIDRGPNAKGVLDIVMSLPNAVCLLGNHEVMMLDALKEIKGFSFYKNNDLMPPTELWMHPANGGSQTLISFGGRYEYKIDPKYINFLEQLKPIEKLPNFYLAHAGIDSRDPKNTSEDILLWDRDCIVKPHLMGGRRLICGHTPTPIDTIKNSLNDDKIVIDGGCYKFHKKEHGLGYLIALRLDDMQIIKQFNIDY